MTSAISFVPKLAWDRASSIIFVWTFATISTCSWDFILSWMLGVLLDLVCEKEIKILSLCRFHRIRCSNVIRLCLLRTSGLKLIPIGESELIALSKTFTSVNFTLVKEPSQNALSSVAANSCSRYKQELPNKAFCQAYKWRLSRLQLNSRNMWMQVTAGLFVLHN